MHPTLLPISPAGPRGPWKILQICMGLKYAFIEFFSKHKGQLKINVSTQANGWIQTNSETFSIFMMNSHDEF